MFQAMILLRSHYLDATEVETISAASTSQNHNPVHDDGCPGAVW